MRRADYSHGRGRLWVAHGRLLFVNDAEHPATESLERAAQADRPSRALATAVIAADFDVPPFVFAEDGERLTGIVCGTIEVHVDDTEPTVVNGADADPWAQVEASPAAVVSTGLDAPDDSHEVLWLESGAVRAGSFRWMPDAVAAGDVETASSRRARSSEPPPDDHRGPGTLPSRSPEPILNADPDATVDASAAIKMLSDAAATAASAPASLDVDSEATIGVGARGDSVRQFSAGAPFGGSAGLFGLQHAQPADSGSVPQVLVAVVEFRFCHSKDSPARARRDPSVGRAEPTARRRPVDRAEPRPEGPWRPSACRGAWRGRPVSVTPAHRAPSRRMECDGNELQEGVKHDGREP